MYELVRKLYSQLFAFLELKFSYCVRHSDIPDKNVHVIKLYKGVKVALKIDI